MRNHLNSPASAAAILAVAALASLLPACASTRPPDASASHAEADSPRASDPAHEADPLFDDDFELEDDLASFPDPMEGMNRHILDFNLVLDRVLFDPITRFYRFVTPDPVERGVRNFFNNLGEVPTFFNDFLQLEWKDAGVASGRLILNSTLGLAGFLEVAEPMGLEPHDSDFGQTLALIGVPSGSYLVVPFMGPSSVRDGTGNIVDLFLSPAAYVFPFIGTGQVLYGGSAGLSTRASSYESLTALKESSVDFYAALRSAWCQHREAEIWARREHRRPSTKE